MYDYTEAGMVVVCVANRKKDKLTGQWAVHWQAVLDYARSMLSWARWR